MVLVLVGLLFVASTSLTRYSMRMVVEPARPLVGSFSCRISSHESLHQSMIMLQSNGDIVFD